MKAALQQYDTSEHANERPHFGKRMPAHMEKNYWQQKSELSQLDDSVRQDRLQQDRAAFEAARLQSAGLMAAAAVPGTDDCVYEPTHPRADWSGMVKRDELGRANDHDHVAMREGVSRTDYGIVPAADASTFDHVAGAGRKHYENDMRFSSNERHAVPLLGGAGGGAPIQSSYQAQTAFQPTPKELLMPHRQDAGRQHVVPAYEQAMSNITNMQQHRTQFGASAHSTFVGGDAPPRAPMQQRTAAYPDQEWADPNGNLAGYRATAFKHGAPSMLANLGAKVTMGGNVPPPNFHHKPGSGVAHEQATARVSLVEGRGTNMPAPGAIPGFTGRRMMR
uniref:Uncharacterized protein n=1 Tax=Florenciella parvula TaxID=236787 RepID=A0A7S2CM62_9STRA|mmetsp:Transcript_30669/g.62612  ORF Transcript_30669/g.62612 Transcript_30669/m.62612 type:complete len:335 (+) Transcript_30669:39-1043(+)|eukprot:CAMPEP_0182546898 /NCGR_PEP_ID=MMETSP1323-20130603/36694_1 /TAXON_ID=236787 /ORGANISM="Florenciella parvula, Strain RCC1693" /LENGTH=334 /DNA_ID=CAMNT_0024758163 /DNA_START=33 /DNA_END=1037 /DNA_ORIENTATION=+